MNTTLTPLAASIERAQAALDRKAAKLGALCYAGDTVRWIKRKLGERRERRAALRTRLEKWRGILS